MKINRFNLKLAVECAHAFADSTRIGYTVSDAAGGTLYEEGYSYVSCEVCRMVNFNPDRCTQAHVKGMHEAERFGGKYIYFCPMGLSCFVSPIKGETGCAAKITAGPFLMVDVEDYIAMDLKQKHDLSDESLLRAPDVLENIPYVPPQKVNSMSTLLHMAVGYLNHGPLPCPPSEGQPSDMIEKTLNYLQANYTRKVTLTEVANHVYLSPSYFSKIFKKELGSSFNTYLNELRVEQGKKLLLSDMRIADIATSVGMDGQSYFTKVFKKVTGMTPNTYRMSRR